MKVWITKYALSTGIKEIEANVSSVSSDMVTESGSIWNHFHGEGRDWHRSREAATAKAEEMRKAKIVSLRKQIAKLERMTF